MLARLGQIDKPNTNDSAICGYHAIGVIRTFIGGEGTPGIYSEGNLPAVVGELPLRPA